MRHTAIATNDFMLAVDPPGSDCPIHRAGTLSGFATGATPIVIAGFTESNGHISGYSAAGPISPTQDLPVVRMVMKINL